MKLRNREVQISEVNYKAHFYPESFIEESEKAYDSEIERVAEAAKENIKEKWIMMICGPSASGKTTTAGKIRKKLANLGVNAPIVSLDDFYLPFKKLPKLEDGRIDYESVNGLDLDLLQSSFAELISKGKAEFPIYDFNKKKRMLEANTIAVGENDILIIEGIHALNPVIRGNFDSELFMNVYIETTTEFKYENKTLMSADDIRMIRRMVRDYHYRSSSLDNTMDMWKGVIEGEHKYIRPYIDLADYVINTTHDYEPNIFHNYFFPIYNQGKKGKYSAVYRRIASVLDMFYDISAELMPSESLLREFI